MMCFLIKAAPSKGSITSSSRVFNWGSSVQVPESMGDIFHSIHCKSYPHNLIRHRLYKHILWGREEAIRIKTYLPKFTEQNMTQTLAVWIPKPYSSLSNHDYLDH